MRAELKEVFKGGYGYDKQIRNHKAEEVGWSSLEEYEKRLDKHFSLNEITKVKFKKVQYVIPKEIFEVISSKKEFAGSVISYAPPIEGFSESDFLKFIEEYPKDYIYINNYRTTLAVRGTELERFNNHNRIWGEYLDRFFSPSYTYTDQKVINNEGRNYSIFRMIELNEFYHRSKNNETLQEYLQRDSKHVKKFCENLLLKRHSEISSDLIYSWIGYTDFENSEIYDLLLTINSEQLGRLLNYLTNVFKNSTVAASNLLENDFNKLIFKYLKKCLEPELTDLESKISSSILLKILLSKADFSDYMEENDYSLEELNLISEKIKKFSYHIDYQVLQLLLSHEGITSISSKDMLSFITQMILYYKTSYRKNKIQDVFNYYALEKNIISPRRFIEFFISIKDPEALKRDIRVLNVDFFKSINDESIPIDWAISMSGVNID